MSSHLNNPFIRGYDRLSIRRVLAISDEADCPLTHLPLHSSQAHLSDTDAARFPCIFNDRFALITEGQEISEALEAGCNGSGIVQAVLYAIHAEEADGSPVHLGDACSRESARETVHRLSFKTGVYSRCWEISALHLAEKAYRFLGELADRGDPAGLWFEAFRIPPDPIVGVKLIATPWTDANLAPHGITAAQLRQEHRSRGVPESLAEVLHLAALADIRILIFDPEAPALDGLPCYQSP